MELNPYAPLYYPSIPPTSLPPPPSLPPFQFYTCIRFFPPCPVFSGRPFAGKPLTVTSSKKKTEWEAWMPKESCKGQRKFLSSTPVAPPPHATVSTHLEFISASSELLMNGTTIMIKNIPNRMAREMLIQMLDQHCGDQQKRLEQVHEEKNFVKSEYDFVYLPIDFSTRANKGYAFVNFTTVDAANNASKEMHRRKWVIYNSKKVARVCSARVQGKTALVNRFKCSQFRCDTDEFLPVTFTRPRNGTTSLPPPDIVGKRINLLPLKHS